MQLPPSSPSLATPSQSQPSNLQIRRNSGELRTASERNERGLETICTQRQAPAATTIVTNDTDHYDSHKVNHELEQPETARQISTDSWLGFVLPTGINSAYDCFILQVLEMAAKVEANGGGSGGVAPAVYTKVPAVAHPLAEKPEEIASNINYHAQFSPHFSPFKFELEQAFYATAESARDRLITQWNETYLHFHKVDPKQTYYLSMEYLQGRALTNAIGNLKIQDAYADAFRKLGLELEEITEQENDAALGNGGLGRLASCFLDSMATLNLPAWGYGLRYRYGLFKQRITREGQEEHAEDWLEKFSPWEVVRHDIVYPVRFFGHVEVNPNGSGSLTSSTVLYPGDATGDGKLLRLKQQFFLCSASLQDLICRFKERRQGKRPWKWSEFPTKVAVQLNDTHPTLAIPELMRLLMDEEGLGWDDAWDVTSRTIAYTNHTVLPEALEKWPQPVMWKLLPRHMEIIEEIDKRFIAMINTTRLDLESKIPSIRILDNNPQKPVVRMANLCVVSSHSILFQYGQQSLRQFADNEHLQAEWLSAKMANKQRLAQYILQVTGVTIDPNSLFDIQVKRIHEYKRQLLNILGVVYRYKKLKEMRPEERKNTTPRTVMTGGKAFATYINAKRIVRLVNDVADVVNNDPEVNSYLKVVFVPNYNVSVAEMLIPGSELSQHISIAGMEASGTSNMKFALNGCLIIGTLDGANVEIREEIGEENFFLLGATADDVPRLRKERENGLVLSVS
ncbi:hypothetical protein L6164_028555 [Bauhinia variegata]|uniref:Uncharacterized protein n=1 Tax=Bauhinia variegata TaxID=167791 RepID=A0ACB9L617_BAUVA|nr:hypothetical protein L6164_028555 [Bauhinia variegata]